MPTALDAGRYSSNGFQLSCQRQDVRATGLPAAAENRLVLPPRLGRRLGERAAHREEQLGGLADDLVAPVGSEPERQDARHARSGEHTSELQSPLHLLCRLLLEKKKNDTPCALHAR